MAQAENRYDKGPGWFRRCGRSGLRLPAISLGFWHNFGAAGTASHGLVDDLGFHQRARELVYSAFDHGVTHFDFANNYGPPPGAAEERAGRILRDLPRGEIVISSKAGYMMWPGPYGNGGSRKHLIESCDESLKRLRVDHLDIFYHHRPDSETPLEESLEALDTVVRSGRALYAGISNYPGRLAKEAMELCREHGWFRPIVHQPKYHMFHRGIESDVLPVAREEGFGLVVFSALAQGLLTSKYLKGVPAQSRAASPTGSLKKEAVSEDVVKRAGALQEVAQARGQTLAQMAITWVLRHETIASALIGTSHPDQIAELVKGAEAAPLSEEELLRIDGILG